VSKNEAEYLDRKAIRRNIGPGCHWHSDYTMDTDKNLVLPCTGGNGHNASNVRNGPSRRSLPFRKACILDQNKAVELS